VPPNSGDFNQDLLELVTTIHINVISNPLVTQLMLVEPD
jgi:hypothetical protein